MALISTGPALSRQIKDLEADLGIRLFDRIRRRLLLTAEGEQLLGVHVHVHYFHLHGC